MHKVGHHLQIEALKHKGDVRDLFARSAYNRYYYDVFLSVREMLSCFDENWSGIPHKSYPKLLTGQITRKFKKEKTRAHRVQDYHLVILLDTGIRAVSALASIIEKANAARITADYEPSERVNFLDSNRYSLKLINISEAHQWQESVRLWISQIQQAWDQING